MSDKKTEIKKNRRDFFMSSFTKSKELLYSAVDMGLKFKFRRKIIRPPGALSEDQFLMKCTRCDKCTQACPYNAIFLVDQIHSGVLFKTPFIDPTHEACRFCEDMPCIKACDDNALVMESFAEVKPIGLAIVQSEHCLVTQGQYCDYCFNSCPHSLGAIKKTEAGLPEIDADICVGCGKCAYICVSQSGDALEITPL